MTDAPPDVPTPDDDPAPTPAPDPLQAAHPPFAATVAGVLALLPDTTLATERPAGTTAVGAPGVGTSRITRVVTVDDVAGWVEELSATVAVRLDGWTRLQGTVTDGAGLADRDAFTREARRLVHAGAASYLEAAKARGNGGPTTGTTGYAEVLWTRFTEGLDALAAWLIARLAAGDPSAGPGEDDGATAGGAAGLPVGHFPPPAIGRRTGF